MDTSALKPEGRLEKALIDPTTCSIEDLKEILRTDPTASLEYARELDRKRALAAEIAHWEKRTRPMRSFFGNRYTEL